MSKPTAKGLEKKYIKDVVNSKIYYVYKTDDLGTSFLYLKECDAFLNQSKRPNALTLNYFLSGVECGYFKILKFTTL